MYDEKRLIRKVQKNGDKPAADALIRQYYDEITAYAFKQTADKHIAMDLAQNIFVSMLKTISRYDGKQAGFRTWLYKIATNKIIDYHRSRSKIYVHALEDIDIPDATDFVTQLENEDLAYRIGEYVGMFDADVQRIFRLKIYGGYTFAEIAGITQMAEATVKTKYYRLLKTLRKEFGNEYHSG